jgi:hypothetical protein
VFHPTEMLYGLVNLMVLVRFLFFPTNVVLSLAYNLGRIMGCKTAIA